MIKKFKNKEYLKKKSLEFIHQYKKKLVLFFILCFSCGLIFTITQKKQTTIITLSLNYKDANDGLNPNGSRFNIFDIKSKSVLKRTIEFAGVKNSYSINNLEKDITILQTNANSKNIPTTYMIQYKKPLNIHEISSEQMTKFLIKAYKEYFKEQYSTNMQIISYDITNYSNTEYLSIIKDLELKTTNISNYINDRLKENTTYRNSDNYTFEDLKKETDNIKDIDIANLTAYINENGLAKNETSLRNVLEYKNQLLDMDYQTNLVGYKTRKDGISFYDSAMSSVVLIPSKDENNDYYMSKTKIGIDYLAKDANNYLNESEWFQSEIRKNTDILSKLATNNSSDTHKKANKMIKNIQIELKTLSKNVIKMDREYIDYKNKNYVTATIQTNTLSKKVIVLLFFSSTILSFILNIICYIFKKIKNKIKIHKKGDN